MKVAVKNVLNNVLRPLGLSINKIDKTRQTVDLRAKVKSPLEGYYWTCGAPFVMNVKVKKCFCIEFPGAAEYNPFIATLRLYGEGLCDKYEGSPLENFYKHWQPGDSDGYYKNGKELAPPWEQGFKKKIHLSEARMKRNDFLKAQSELSELGEIKGQLKKGPVTKSFGKVTFQRFTGLYDSIKENGFEPEKMGGHITGKLYVRDGSDYRVAVSGGKHRMTVLQALGFTNVPIQLSTIVVKREDVKYWPNVRNGNYTEEEALAYFDRIFENEHPLQWEPMDSWKKIMAVAV
ncbi:ParB N-terminal domain-containing protein [Litoribacter populi]|uniref:hypothetical protein n=1 Tax=Litoribacter populi TaxID=2598460 RepID=UPI00117C0CA1|nr:hypothetical protein [Litoribacter populi]